MTNAQGQIVGTLNHLIEVGKDGELSCTTGAREVHNPEIARSSRARRNRAAPR